MTTLVVDFRFDFVVAFEFNNGMEAVEAEVALSGVVAVGEGVALHTHEATFRAIRTNAHILEDVNFALHDFAATEHVCTPVIDANDARTLHGPAWDAHLNPPMAARPAKASITQSAVMPTARTRRVLIAHPT